MVAKGIERGGAVEAKAWVAASKLAAADKKALGRFVERFAGLQFYRELPEAQARNEKEATLPWPAWLKAIRGSLAGVHGKPGFVKVRFDGFDSDDSPRAERAANTLYTLERPVFATEQERTFLGRKCTALPFARDLKTGHSTLCFGLDASNKSEIYECTEEDLWDAEADGEAPDESFYKAFKSYRSMLDRIVEVEVDGQVVKALGDRRGAG